MSRKRVIVKRIHAIQNLGAMDVLCTDKTDTLTMDHVSLDPPRLPIFSSHFDEGLLHSRPARPGRSGCGPLGTTMVFWLRILGVLCLLGLPGCARLPYRHGSVDQYLVSQELVPLTEPSIEFGQRRPILDGIGWVIGIPSKIVLWNRRIDNHAVTDETVEAISDYLAFNELQTVKVRVNQYAPRQDWNRLVANKSVGWGWRYSFGALTWLGEAVFPGRIWGGDHFNPFSNTIHLYSDVPAVAIHEAGHAKDFARRKWKGTYAAVYALPVVPLWHEAIATNDALGYLHENAEVAEIQDAYRILYPAYGTYIGSAAANFVPWNGLLVYAGAVIPAHVAGRWRARQHGRYVAESLRDSDSTTEQLDHDVSNNTDPSEF